MILFLTPIAIIATLIILTFFISFNNSKKRKRQLVWLFDLLRTGRKLIQYIPAHRGMANAYLKGDESFKGKMEEMQNKIDNIFEQLVSISNQPLSLVEANDLRQHASRWAELKKNVYSISAEKSFIEHTAIISSLLEMMEDSAVLASICNSNKGYELIIKAVVKDIPQLTETLGQARGLGTGVAAQAECSVANRIKLGFLRESGMKVLKNTITSLVDSSHPGLESSHSSLQACRDKANNFLDCINEKIIKAHRINIAPNEYYSTATAAIDNSFALLDQLLDVLEKTLVRK